MNDDTYVYGDVDDGCMIVASQQILEWARTIPRRFLSSYPICWLYVFVYVRMYVHIYSGCDVTIDVNHRVFTARTFLYVEPATQTLVTVLCAHTVVCGRFVVGCLDISHFTLKAVLGAATLLTWTGGIFGLFSTRAKMAYGIQLGIYVSLVFMCIYVYLYVFAMADFTPSLCFTCKPVFYPGVPSHSLLW